jgi:hypothetical protein
VGNEGRRGAVLSLFSKCPEMHKRVLEIQGNGKGKDEKRDDPGIHFSEENYGDYGFFY